MTNTTTNITNTTINFDINYPQKHLQVDQINFYQLTKLMEVNFPLKDFEGVFYLICN